MKPVEIYLNAYLEQLEAQLGDLPPQRRAEILDEARAHLDAMTLARRADGMDENDAWRSARSAFGDAEMVGRELAREWKRAPRVETVGTPLSPREKLKLFALPILVGVVVYSLFLMVHERLQGNPQSLRLAPEYGGMGLGVWFWWRGGKKRSPATILSYSLCFLGFLRTNFHVIFSSQLRGTTWGSIDFYFPFVLLPLLILSMIWLKRESKLTKPTKPTLPWRRRPRYAQNPMAAEETYRFTAKNGLITGVTIGCLGNLSLAKFFGIQVALGLCVGEILLAFLLARALDRSS